MECVIFTYRTKREEEPEGQRKRGDGFGVETSQMVKDRSRVGLLRTVKGWG
jgi:hypothetical protein